MKFPVINAHYPDDPTETSIYDYGYFMNKRPSECWCESCQASTACYAVYLMLFFCHNI